MARAVAGALALAALALPSPAAAHVPHDVVADVAAPADLSPDLPWLLLSVGEGWVFVSVSEDGGRTWEMRALDPQIDALVAVAVTADDTWVAASAGRLWWSTDEGASWERVAAPAPVRALAGGDDVAIATGDGLYAWAPGSAPVLVAEGPVTALAGGPDGRAAALAGGAVWLDRGGWAAAGAVSSPVSAVAVAGDMALAGSADGSVWALAGEGWARCGALPEAPGNVVRMAADGDEVLVASASGRLYATDPTCARWEDVGSPVLVDYGGSGGATDPAEAATALAAADGRWLHAGWAGVGVATEGAWYSPVVLPADYTRGVAFSPDYARDGRIWVGGYAGGLAVTADGGATWAVRNTGLTEPNLQRLAFPFGAVDDRDVIALCDYSPWRSADGGASWEEQASPYRFPVGLAVWDDGDTVWAFADPTRSGDPPVSVSGDGGASWAPDAALTEAVGPSVPGGVARVDWGERRLALAAGSPTRILAREGDGAWVPVYVDPLADGLAGPVSWPEDHPARLVFADSAGVHSSEDGAAWSTWDGLGEDRAVALTVVDHTLFLATRGGWLWRSADGGRTWVDLAARLPAPVHALTGARDDAGVLRLLVGTQDGTFTLDDPRAERPTVLRWAPYQRIDDRSPYLACAGCGASVRDDAAAMSSVRPLGAAGVASTALRGESIAVYGTATASGRAAVYVDGERRADLFGLNAPTPTLLAAVDGLAWGWHDLEIRAEADGIAIDAVESVGSGERFPPVAQAIGAGCGGCASPPSGAGGGGAAAALLLVAAGRRRRRRRAAPAGDDAAPAPRAR